MQTNSVRRVSNEHLSTLSSVLLGTATIPLGLFRNSRVSTWGGGGGSAVQFSAVQFSSVDPNPHGVGGGSGGGRGGGGAKIFLQFGGIFEFPVSF